MDVKKIDELSIPKYVKDEKKKPNEPPKEEEEPE